MYDVNSGTRYISEDKWMGNDVYVEVVITGARVDTWLCVDTGLDADGLVVGEVGVKDRAGGSADVVLLKTELEVTCAGCAKQKASGVSFTQPSEVVAPTHFPNLFCSTASSGNVAAALVGL